MSKKKDCFGKMPMEESSIRIPNGPRYASRSSTTYTCRTNDCPYMADCVLASMYADPVETYQRKERRKSKVGTRVALKDLSVIASR